MKVFIGALVFALFLYHEAYSQIYQSTTGNAKFKAIDGPDNINAESKKLKSAFDLEKKEVAFSIEIESFVFKNKLMKEHFNENYMESEKYPKSTFTGFINGEIETKTKKRQDVTVKGKLMIHGIEMEREVKGMIEFLDDKKVRLKSTFEVKFSDHKIEPPKILYKVLTEAVTVEIESILVRKD